MDHGVDLELLFNTKLRGLEHAISKKFGWNKHNKVDLIACLKSLCDIIIRFAEKGEKDGLCLQRFFNLLFFSVAPICSSCYFLYYAVLNKVAMYYTYPGSITLFLQIVSSKNKYEAIPLVKYELHEIIDRFILIEPFRVMHFRR
jgi:hypothetical protein